MSLARISFHSELQLQRKLGDAAIFLLGPLSPRAELGCDSKGRTGEWILCRQQVVVVWSPFPEVCVNKGCKCMHWLRKTLEFLISHKQPRKYFLQDIICSLLSMCVMVFSVFAVGLAFPSCPCSLGGNGFQVFLTNILPFNKPSNWCFVFSILKKLKSDVITICLKGYIKQSIFRKMDAFRSISSRRVYNMGNWRLMQPLEELKNEGQSFPMISAALTQKGSYENVWKLLAKRCICCPQVPLCLLVATNSK